MFSLICVWINDWVNNREAGDLRRYRAHYDVIVMIYRSNFLKLDIYYAALQIEIAEQVVAYDVMDVFGTNKGK